MKLNYIRTIKRTIGVILIVITAIIMTWGIFCDKQGIAIVALLLINLFIPLLKID